VGEQLTYREAIAVALADELEADEQVVLIGEDVGAAGGVFKATEGLFERFGDRRVRDTPISEQAIVGCALGAAVMGMRPVAEIMFADFAGVCFDQIVNQMAKYRYQSAGQTDVPVTIRMACGGSVGFGAQHSQCVENWFLNVPGIKLCLPATPADMYTLTRAAVRDNNPVIVFEHKALYAQRGELAEPGSALPLGRAEVVRRGTDITVVATQLMRHRALEAADALAGDGIQCEVIDPRSIAPLDMDTVMTSLAETGRLVCVQEATAAGSWGQAVITEAVHRGFELFDARPKLVAADAVPVPYAKSLEDATLPSVERILFELRETASE
jgi:pyruvate/2-oxoglutarate/acetoin dehydrogenase E1 component